MELISKDKLVEDNIGLVHSVAKKYIGKGIEYEDLVGYGMVGLVHAANRYDSSKGVMFSTFAYRCIWNVIRKAFRDSRWLALDTISMEVVTSKNSDGNEVRLEGLIADDAAEFVNRKADIEAVRDAMDVLDDRELFVICNLYEIGMKKQTQQVIAKEIGVSQIHVSRIQRKGLKKMKNALVEWGCI